MEDALLLIAMLAIFAFGFLVVRSLDDFIEKNNRLIASADRMGSRCVRIASENPAYFDAVAAALENCADANPYMDFRLSSARPKRLMCQLTDGEIDIAFLSEESAENLDAGFGCATIPCQQNQEIVTGKGLTVENAEDARRFAIVWNRSVQSKDRDRVLFALENEHLRLECGC